MNQFGVTDLLMSRRDAVKKGFQAGLAGFFALAHAQGFGQTTPASKPSKEGDIKIMNIALSLEYEAVAAYDIGIKTGFLTGAPLDLARHFQAQHATHRDVLIAAIRENGGKPMPQPETFEFDDDPATIKEGKDVLRFALGYETGATTAYLSVLPNLFQPKLLPIVAGIAADEAQHAAVLRYALGRNPVPQPIVR